MELVTAQSRAGKAVSGQKAKARRLGWQRQEPPAVEQRPLVWLACGILWCFRFELDFFFSPKRN